MITLRSDYTIKTERLTAAKNALEEIKQDSMAGWLTVPVNDDELNRMKAAAQKIQSESKYLVCIGIGGSYLGHKAVIDAIGNKSGVKILYAGNSLSSDAFYTVLNEIGSNDFSVNVISKSGTTTEPAIAFRLFKAILKNRYGNNWSSRVYATTDAKKGALHDEAEKNNYTSFVVPDDIGGRYSVLTAVGILPMLVAGIDVDAMLKAARTAAGWQRYDFGLAMNPANEDPAVHTFEEAVRYAIIRQDLYANEGLETEVLASFEPRFATFSEWWKQLFGESEGKQNKGIFPASVVYTTDLHSLGQYMQEGRRNIFETVVKITTPSTREVKVPSEEGNLDGLDYLAGKTLEYVNSKAAEATINAHKNGGIPVLELELNDLKEKSVGELIYFFELSCAISAKLSGVNPFDQPGVEAYKTNMFKLLGKPGF
ncbi:glucose-6-phosphate isomerase [Candidatus Saccharibacteria bacterium]|nr:glucose-6-phosphate isomerase [Candidatus Saccharibacteria bacterium]